MKSIKDPRDDRRERWHDKTIQDSMVSINSAGVGFLPGFLLHLLNTRHKYSHTIVVNTLHRSIGNIGELREFNGVN